MFQYFQGMTCNMGYLKKSSLKDMGQMMHPVHYMNQSAATVYVVDVY